MNLCSDGHEEVCYEGRRCPACDLKADLEAVEEDLNKEIQNLTDEINSLEGN